MNEITLNSFRQPLTTSVNLPGCIGYTIRALNLAALTKGNVKIINPLKSDDTYSMVEALRSLGIEIQEGDDYFLVVGDISDIKDQDYEINIGLSGRSARTLLALLSIVPGTKVMTCAAPFKKRPIADLVDGLRQLGADITYLEREGYLPVQINSQTLRSGTVRMPGALSSQYFSAIMMIAPAIGGITIEVEGEQSSRPFIDMTIGIMKAFGVDVTNENYHAYTVSGSIAYRNPQQYQVEPEATSASYFFAIAALTGSTIKVLHIDPDSLQGDIYFADVLAKMGCQVRKHKKEKWIEVTGPKTLKSVTVNMNATPDLVPTLAVLAAFAEGKTIITNIAHARLKETDRIKAPATELKKMGIRTESTDDSLTVYGGKPKAAKIETYHDHRMAMAFAVAGMRLEGMSITDPRVVNKSFPEFWDVLAALTITEKNIVLTGMRGSGKSTVGHIVANKLGRQFINMDTILADHAGMSIPKMVSEKGWDYFRDQETALCESFAGIRQTVISTGGGVILRPQNIATLKAHGIVVFLDTSIDNLEMRLKDETDGRPALTNASSLRTELEQVLSERKTTYQKTADIQIATDNLTPEQIAEKIVKKIRTSV